MSEQAHPLKRLWQPWSWWTDEHSPWRKDWRRFAKNKLAVASLGFIILLSLVALCAPWISPYGYDELGPGIENQMASWSHWFGTDPLGRDLLTRNLYAARNALLVGMGAVLVGLGIGLVFGSLAGFYGGWIDLVVMRVVDILFAFPQFLLMVILVGVLGRNIPAVFLAIGLVSWAGYARLTRGLVLQAREELHVEAARGLGAGDFHILRRYVLPNIMGPLLVSTSFGIPAAMMAESGLSLIGLGLRPPMPSWGNLITDGAVQILGYPHLVLFPALFFGITLLAFTFIGDGLSEVYARES